MNSFIDKLVLAGVLAYACLISLLLFLESQLVIYPTQFLSIGGLQIRFYAIFIVLGVWLGYELLHRQILPQLNKFDHSMGLLMVATGAFVGARLFFIATAGDWVNLFNLSTGGLHLFGGLIGGGVAAVGWCHWHKFPWRELVWGLVVVLPLIQAVGRLGNFFNHELFGVPTEGLPFVKVLPEQNPFVWLHNYTNFIPLFYYEILANLAIFVILYFKSRKQGLGWYLVKLYILLYGVVRFMLDFWRLDNNQGFGQLTYAQWIILGIFIGCGIIALVLNFKQLRTSK